MQDILEEKNSIPLPSIKRLPIYLRIVEDFINEGKNYISTTDFEELLSIKAIQVRKDLSIAGAIGKPKIGYNTVELQNIIMNFTGLSNYSSAVLVGVGGLGSALLGYKGFDKYGLQIVAGFDNNEEKIEKTIRDKKIYSVNKLKSFIAKNKISIGIIAVPANSAQEIANIMIESNIKGIWNFSPTHINVPKDIFLQSEDLGASLAVLSVRIKTGI